MAEFAIGNPGQGRAASHWLFLTDWTHDLVPVCVANAASQRPRRLRTESIKTNPPMSVLGLPRSLAKGNRAELGREFQLYRRVKPWIELYRSVRCTHVVSLCLPAKALLNIKNCIYIYRSLTESIITKGLGETYYTLIITTQVMNLDNVFWRCRS